MSTIKYQFDSKGVPLIKFQSADRIESLRKEGHIYAKTLAYYRKREEETGDDKIGDKFEGMWHISEGIITIDGESVAVSDTLLNTSQSDNYVFCMFGIDPNVNSFTFTEEQKEKMISFGDTALIILDGEEFVRRVYRAAEEQGCEVHSGTVQYYDPSIDSVDMMISLVREMWRIALWKRESYSYQQEKRFVFIPKDKTMDHLDLYIGDISDISKVVSAEDALKLMIKKTDRKYN